MKTALLATLACVGIASAAPTLGDLYLYQWDGDEWIKAPLSPSNNSVLSFNGSKVVGSTLLSTFAAASHTHNVSDISGLGYFATGTDAANLTGTLAPARIVDGSLTTAKTNGLQAALDGKETAGSAAAAQAYSIQRANHTGTQAQSTVTNLVSDLTTLNTHVANVANPHSVTKAQIGLSNVENTALSTWPGSSNITTLGTVATGVWNATAIADNKIASSATWNGKQNAITFGNNVQAALGVDIGLAGAPVLLNGAGGTPSSINLGNGSNLPINTGISGLGLNVASALATAPSSTGGMVLFNGAGGTPSSINLTNATNFPTLNQNTTGSAGSLSLSGGGTITGASGAITIATSGTNQNINLTPSGTGEVATTGTLNVNNNVVLTRGGSNNLESASNIWTIKCAGNNAATVRANGVIGLNATTYISPNGAGVLAVSSGTTAGNSNGTITLTNLIASGYIANTPATRSGPGAVSNTVGLTLLTTTGVADAITLANGVAGQHLTIVHDVDGGSAVLTPATKTGWSTATISNAGDTISLVYVATRGWMVTSSYGTVVTP